MVQVMVQNYFLAFFYFSRQISQFGHGSVQFASGGVQFVDGSAHFVSAGLQFVDDGVQFANAGLKYAIFGSTCTYNFSSMCTLAMILCFIMTCATRNRKAKPDSSSIVGESNRDESQDKWCST